MSKSINNHFKNAIILHANHAPFSPDGNIINPFVQSRMLLWCRSGYGTVKVNDTLLKFEPGSFLFTPWEHRISYKADSKKPFFLGGVHIIPELKCGVDFEWLVFHYPPTDANMMERRNRHDLPIPGFEKLYVGKLNDGAALFLLAEYIVSCFEQMPHEESVARNLAQVLLCELVKTANTNISKDAIPHSLQRILEFIEKNLENKISIEQLPKIGECSKPSLFRLFRIHIKYSPCNWILKRKIEHAAELFRTSCLRVGEAADRIKIYDHYYFSKVFRKFMGISARDYRRKNSMINPL